MKRATLVLAVLALFWGDAFSPSAAAGPITYYLQNYPADQGLSTVYGTITTDGTIGPLLDSNIISASLTVSGLRSVPQADVTFPGPGLGLVATSNGNLVLPAGSSSTMTGFSGIGVGTEVSWERPLNSSSVYFGGPYAGVLLWSTTNPHMAGEDPWVIASRAIVPIGPPPWNFRLLVLNTGFLWYVDPSVATGYSYSVDPNGPLISSVVAPTTVAGQPLTTNLALSYNGTSTQITPGVPYTFSQPVSTFQITGIPASFTVDPTNTQAFVTGLTFDETGAVDLTMAPLTSSTTSAVPEPASLTLLGFGSLGLLGYGWRRRR